MSYCLNPYCSQPQNWSQAEICQHCGSHLLLREHYRAIHPLAQGSFGRTFLAVDEDRLETPCVIKQFWPQVRGENARQKATELFKREAKQLLQLGEHPQIPTLLASFAQEDHLYLVQEFIDGQNLHQELQTQGCFQEEQIRELLVGLLPVLEFVHQHGVIHRDIKPENILRRLPPATQAWRSSHHLVLVDFGVAKQNSDFTGTGTLTGTIGYAPIEQIRGGRSYPASDLYSLGVTCVQLLTNITPDALFDPVTGELVWRCHLGEQNRNITPHLSQILDKLLQDLVRDRYQSATEVLQALLEQEPSTVSTKTTYRFPLSVPAIHSELDIIVEAELEALKTQLTKLQAEHPELPILERESPPSQPEIYQPATVFHPPSSPTVEQAEQSETPTAHPLNRIWQAVQTHTPSIWKCLQVLPGHHDIVTDLIYLIPSRGTHGHHRETEAAASPLLMSSSHDKTVKLWHPLTGDLISSFLGHVASVNALEITPDQRVLISGSTDRTILAWNLHTGTLLDRFYSYSGSPYSHRGGAIHAVAISPDGRTIASGSADRSIKLWNQRNGELLYRLTGHRDAVLSVAYAVPDLSLNVTSGTPRTHHPQCWMLASGSADSTIKIWRVGTSESLRTLSGHQGAVHTLVFSPDGHTLISGSADATVKLWNFHTGELLHTLTGHQHPVISIAISPDGSTLASSTSEGSVKLWDLKDLQEIAEVEGCSPVTFSPDGRVLVTGGENGRVLVWQHCSGSR